MQISIKVDFVLNRVGSILRVVLWVSQEGFVDGFKDIKEPF